VALFRFIDTILRVKAFSEYYKLIEVAIVQVLGSIEDERCFSSLAFVKNKPRNSLDPHQENVVEMYSQKIFTLETFLIMMLVTSGLKELMNDMDF